MSDEATNYKQLKRQYERRVSMILWVGAGLAGLVAITTGDAFDAASPSWLKAVEITLIIVCAAFFAKARVGFEWEATKIQRMIDDAVVQDDTALPPEMKVWPREAEECWNHARTTLIIAGVVMAACFWWPVIIDVYKHMTTTPENQPARTDTKSGN